MYLALGVLAWKLSPAGVGLLTTETMYIMWIGLFGLFLFQTHAIYQVNKENLANGVPDLEKYKFKQVAILDIAYFVTFGSELAVVSMLPLYFLDTFAMRCVPVPEIGLVKNCESYSADNTCYKCLNGFYLLHNNTFSKFIC